jgi:hypothetical protein
VVVGEEVQSNKAAVGRKLIDLPGYVFRVFVTSRSDSALEIWRDWGGYSQRKPLFNSLLQWPTPTSPKFDSPNENAA